MKQDNPRLTCSIWPGTATVTVQFKSCLLLLVLLPFVLLTTPQDGWLPRVCSQKTKGRTTYTCLEAEKHLKQGIGQKTRMHDRGIPHFYVSADLVSKRKNQHVVDCIY